MQPHTGAGSVTNSSPAIDPTNRLYVYSYGLDGKAHKHQVGDGIDITTGGWPQLASLKPQVEKVAGALSTATAHNGANYLYVPHGGYNGDGGDYQGHVTAIDLSTGRQNVFNTLCSDQFVHFTTSTPIAACGGRPSGPRTGSSRRRDRPNLPGDGQRSLRRQHRRGQLGRQRARAQSRRHRQRRGMPMDSYTRAITTRSRAATWTWDRPVRAPSGPGLRGTPRRPVRQARMLRLIDLTDMSGQGAGRDTPAARSSPARSLRAEVLTVPAVSTIPRQHHLGFLLEQFRHLGVETRVSGRRALARPEVAGPQRYIAARGQQRSLPGRRLHAPRHGSRDRNPALERREPGPRREQALAEPRRLQRQGLLPG
jgi:hypothetical protein